MGAEGGGSSLANIIICSNCRTYLFKLLNVFVLNAKFISLTCKMYWVVQCRAEWVQKEAAALWQISAISHRKSGISLIYTNPSWNRYLQIILCKIQHLFLQNSTPIPQKFNIYFSGNVKQLKLEALAHIHWSVQTGFVFRKL